MRCSACAFLAGLALAACAPALDWRQLRLDGADLRAWFPCRPVAHGREVTIAGRAARMTVHACKAAETVFGVGLVEVDDPASVGPALRELREAALANVGAGAASAVQPYAAKGATPNADAVRLRLLGRRPDGSPVRSELALFARGTRVYQATVLGSSFDAVDAQTFLDGIELRP